MLHRAFKLWMQHMHRVIDVLMADMVVKLDLPKETMVYLPVFLEQTFCCCLRLRGRPREIEYALVNGWR